MAKAKKSANRTYGWRPDKPDHRDYRFTQIMKKIALPSKIDLTPGCPPVWDQGNIGSCTAQAIAANFQFDEIKQGTNRWRPSRLFIYYNERLLEGTTRIDAGAEIRDGIRAIRQWGVPSEDAWKYIEANVCKKPGVKTYAWAIKNNIESYYRLLQSETELKTCLASGYPFTFGFSVYESFESDVVDRTGVVPMPKMSEKLLGGHAVLAVGYNDLTRKFKCRNSWGVDWGQAGYFHLPYDYVLNDDLSADFWTFKRVILG